jgi:2-methylisocitrate lyase-like PEP mutase family enzyme
MGQRFLELHVPGTPLLMPNPWDVGSARLLVSLGFKALATTSSGHAATLGRLDGGVTREEAIAHAAAIATAVAPDGVPVSADLEHGFFDEPEDVAETAELAVAAGLAGFSIEDSTGVTDAPIYDRGLAVDRIAAAAAVTRAAGCVLTGRCEMYLHGQRDLAAVIDRLQAYSAAGADVLFAPGVVELDEVRTLVDAVDKPVNVLPGAPGSPPIADLAAAGVARISVGGGFAFAAYGALVEAATELRDTGTYGFREGTAVGAKAVRSAFGPR